MHLVAMHNIWGKSQHLETEYGADAQREVETKVHTERMKDREKTRKRGRKKEIETAMDRDREQWLDSC